MTSCAVSCCICCPKVSFASATSVFWPTASGSPPCRSACKHCRQRRNNNSSQILPPPITATLGTVPNVVLLWRLSNGSHLPKFNFVLHRWPHETTLSNSNSLRASARSASLCPVPNQSPLLPSSIALPATPPFPAHSFSAPLSCALHYGTVWVHPQRRSFSLLNLHKAASAAITVGFLHVAVSKAHIHYVPLSASCLLALPDTALGLLGTYKT